MSQTPARDAAHRFGRVSVISRRQLLGGAGVALASFAVSACTNSDNGQPSSGGESDVPNDDGFPATVTHRYGETTIPSKPQRIIALGQTDLDPVVALGFTPIAVGGFVGGDYDPIHPWNEQGFPDESPPILDMEELEFEKIAALSPDLITCGLSGITEADYETLSAICPVVAQHPDFGDFAVPYQEHTLLIAQALGQEAEGQRLIDELEARFAEVREAHPEWAGMTAYCAESFGSDYFVLGANTPRVKCLQDVGFLLPPDLVELGGPDYSNSISAEKLSLVNDLDLLCWALSADELDDITSDPIIKGLKTSTEGRTLWTTDGTDDHLFWATDWGTILSSNYVIDNGVPKFERAVDGDLATDPNTGEA